MQTRTRILMRRWLAASGLSAVLLVVAAVLAWPAVVRGVMLSRLESLTHRQAQVEAVWLNPFTGRLGIRGFRLLEPDGATRFVDLERLDARFRPLSLLGGHLWLRDLAIEGSTIHVVRLAEGFNFTDLIQQSGASGHPLDVTVDRLVVTRGAVQMEDRALPEPRTWTSEGVEIEARNLSTRRGDGQAVARWMAAGAQVGIQMRSVRLYPIHLEAEVTTSGLDVALARVYLPPGAPIVERGRASTRLEVALDAREGLSARLSGEILDLAVVEPGQREPALLVSKLGLRLEGFRFQDDRLQVGELEVAGSGSVRDPTGSGTRRRQTTVRATLADVTWPITGPGRLDLEGRVQGAGLVKLTGSLRPPPAASQLRLRVTGVDIGPWARLFPGGMRVEGIGDADLSLDEPLAPGVPGRVRGTVALGRAGLWDGQRQRAGVDRIEASDLAIEWPSRITAGRVSLVGPRVTVERDRSGGFPGLSLAPAPALEPPTPGPPAAAGETPAGAPVVTVGEVVVRDGSVSWRDEALTPAVALDVTRLQARMSGVAWPLQGPVGIRASARSPGGGEVQVSGRVGLAPMTADLRVVSRGAEVGPYRRYLTTASTVAGRADLDVEARVVTADDSAASWSATVRGQAALTGVDVRDGQRTILRLERGVATGLDVEWPRRALVGELRLDGPWVLLERDRSGALGLRGLLPAGHLAGAAVNGSGDRQDASVPDPQASGPAMPVTTIRTLVVEGGGARVVDQRIEPPVAVDVVRLSGRLQGLSTDPAARPARVDLTARSANTSVLTVSGTVGPLGGPLRLELDGELRDFAVPRANPYLVERVAWEARDGWLGTTARVRVDGDALDARATIRLSRLEVARAGAHDGAQARMGLPLGMIVALMKDRRGEIRVTLPVGGKLSDPRFDLSEAIWQTVRNVAFKAITAPVSWIGRVRYSADARIERIDIDPVPFPPGGVALTAEAREQVGRVAAFLEQAPAVRLALTPVLSAGDRAALGRAKLEAEVRRVAQEQQVSADDALGRLFRQRLPRQPAPPTADDLRAALEGTEPVVPAELATLASRRAAAVRDELRRAGVEAGRLREVVATEVPAEGSRGQVSLDLLEPDSPGPPSRRVGSAEAGPGRASAGP